MTTRQKIDLAREIRLGLTQVIIPVTSLAVTVLSIPEVRESINEKIKAHRNKKRAVE